MTVAKSDRRRGEIGPVAYSQDTKAPTAGQPEARIVVHDVSKVFSGNIRAVDRLSFTVEPGSVTGFLSPNGPNGAGKTTTLRMALGLVCPSGGYATIGGRLYRDIANPLAVVGALLESSSFHPARTGRNHLRILCMVAGLPARRRRGARHGRPARRGETQGARLLAGHATAPRPGCGAGRRSPGAHPRRARQRPGSGRHPLATRLLPSPCERGPNHPRVQPPAQRSTGERRPRRHPQPRPIGAVRLDRRAHRRHRHRAHPHAERAPARQRTGCSRRDAPTDRSGDAADPRHVACRGGTPRLHGGRRAARVERPAIRSRGTVLRADRGWDAEAAPPPNGQPVSPHGGSPWSA